MLIGMYVILIFFTIFFVIATVIKNNSIVDIGWGIGFVITSWIVFFFRGEYNFTKIIINIMISLWGLRLFYYILKRNIFEKEDFRYANWRKAWGKWVIPRAFLQVFMLQGFLQFLIASPAIYMNDNDLEFKYLSVIGIIIWIVGFIFEVLGDKQLKDHIKNPEMNGKLLKTGLWKYTRHPNYFGEATMWWGIFIFAFITGIPFYLIISPITITVVLYFISTPILEKKMAEREDWAEYAKNTPMFIPIKVKKS